MHCRILCTPFAQIIATARSHPQRQQRAPPGLYSLNNAATSAGAASTHARPIASYSAGPASTAGAATAEGRLPSGRRRMLGLRTAGLPGGGGTAGAWMKALAASVSKRRVSGCCASWRKASRGSTCEGDGESREA